MVQDAAPPTSGFEQRVAPDFAMPAVKSVEIRRESYQPRKRRYVPSPHGEGEDVVVVEIEFVTELPARAQAPVLHIGSVALVNSEKTGPLQWRFIFFGDLGRLAQDAPMVLAWWDDPPERGVRLPEVFRMPDPR
jgi:hypothetical protein